MASHRSNSSSVIIAAEADSSSSNALAENDKAGVEKEKVHSSISGPIASVAQVWFCVMYYFVVSLSLTFLNKEVLNAFRAPLFMTLFQFFIALLLIKAIGVGGSYVPSIAFFPDFTFSYETFMQTRNLGIAYVAMVCITNVTIYNVSLLLFQFLRALVIPFSICLSFYQFRTLPSFKAGAASSCVVVGFFIGALTDMTASTEGVFFGVLSSLTCSIYAIQVKKTLAVLGNDTFLTLFYNTLWSIALLTPLTLVFELNKLPLELSVLFKSSFQMWLFVIAAVLGFCINIAYVMLIRSCSPLTCHITGSFKSALQSVLVLIFYDTSTSHLNKVGLAVVMGASTAYSYIQFSASKTNAAAVVQKNEAPGIPSESAENGRELQGQKKTDQTAERV